MINIILFGPPGAGKGTQSEKLIEKYQLTHISTGDLFRKHLGEGTELGKLAQSYMDAGNLVPDKVVIGMVDEKLGDTYKETNGYILDGFPRTVAQAESLDQLMAKYEMPITAMLALQVPDAELEQRLMKRGETSGRADDQNMDKIKHRIQVYKNETLPVADYYQKQEKYHAIEGVGSIDEIFNTICSKIEQVN